MQPRSMLFTLYGVYIRHFTSEIWLGTLIRLLGEFGFSEQAVRAALTRLATQGWVETRKVGRNNYLHMTAKGLQRVDEAANRIYHLPRQTWDGRWFLLTYSIPEEKRKLRDQLRNDLSWLGWGTLSAGVWITPYNLANQVREVAQNYDILSYLDFFNAYYCGPETNQELVAKSWSLELVNERYRQFLERFRPVYQQANQMLTDQTLTDQQCFVQRTWLVHEYRKFLHIDPALPEELLGEDWLGSEAFDLFRSYDHLLSEGAGRYFYQIFSSAPEQVLTQAETERALEAQLNPFSVANASQIA